MIKTFGVYLSFVIIWPQYSSPNAFLINDIYSDDAKEIIKNKPKLIIRRTDTKVAGIYSHLLVWGPFIRFANEYKLDVYFDLKHYMLC